MFELSAGTVVGSDHARTGKNNQDALCVHQNEERTVIVVCDGCSSGVGGISHNEVGAHVGARMVSSVLCDQIYWKGSPDWDEVSSAAVSTLKWLVYGMAGDFSDQARRVVANYFLFTVVAAVITPRRAEFAAIGDGTIIINEERLVLGPFENNTPYLGYALIPSQIDPALLRFRVLREMPTTDLESFLLGTDGCDDLIRAWDKTLSNGQPVGAIEHLWQDDRFFANPDVLRRHLVLANGGVDRRGPAHLKDDTTLVVGRRPRG